MPEPDFRMRSKRRDHACDIDRFERACRVLAGLLAEIRAEADGLARRHHGASDSAAFAFQAHEDGGDPHLSQKADALVAAMGRYAQRRGELAVQEALLDDLLRKLEPFAAGPQEGEADPPVPPGPRTGRLSRLIGVIQRA